MTDQLSRIFGPVDIANGTSTVFTGVQGTNYTIRSILIANATTGSIAVALGINGLANANLILPSVTLGPGEQANFDGILVLAGAETLQASTNADGLTITASGLAQS